MSIGDHGALKHKDMKAISAQVVSCCVFKNKKNYAEHAWQRSIHIGQLGRSSCSSPSP